jgi:hypothetical protein
MNPSPFDPGRRVRPGRIRSVRGGPSGDRTQAVGPVRGSRRRRAARRHRRRAGPGRPRRTAQARVPAVRPGVQGVRQGRLHDRRRPAAHQPVGGQEGRPHPGRVAPGLPGQEVLHRQDDRQRRDLRRPAGLQRPVRLLQAVRGHPGPDGEERRDPVDRRPGVAVVRRAAVHRQAGRRHPDPDHGPPRRPGSSSGSCPARRTCGR